MLGAAKRFKKVANATALIWMMLLVVEKNFRRLRAPHLLKDLYLGAKYYDGIRVDHSAPEALAA